MSSERQGRKRQHKHNWFVPVEYAGYLKCTGCPETHRVAGGLGAPPLPPRQADPGARLAAGLLKGLLVAQARPIFPDERAALRALLEAYSRDGEAFEAILAGSVGLAAAGVAGHATVVVACEAALARRLR